MLTSADEAKEGTAGLVGVSKVGTRRRPVDESATAGDLFPGTGLSGLPLVRRTFSVATTGAACTTKGDAIWELCKRDGE